MVKAVSKTNRRVYARPPHAPTFIPYPYPWVRDRMSVVTSSLWPPNHRQSLRMAGTLVLTKGRALGEHAGIQLCHSRHEGLGWSHQMGDTISFALQAPFLARPGSVGDKIICAIPHFCGRASSSYFMGMLCIALSR